MKHIQKSNPTLKDNDYLMLMRSDIEMVNINITPIDRTKILEILKKDVEFFSNHGLMDYSLLLGIEKIH